MDQTDPGWPYTKIASGFLVVRGSGPIRVFGQVRMTGAFVTAQARLRVNGGADLAVGTAAQISGFVYVLNDCGDGDQLALWVTESVGGSSLTTGATNTYLSYEPLGSGYSSGVAMQRGAIY